MLEIRVPKRATDNDTYQLSKLCAEAERERGPVSINCTDTQRFGPIGVAMLGSVFSMRRILGRETLLQLPGDPLACDFVREIGLDQFANGYETGCGTLELRQLTALDAVYTQAVVELLARGVPGITDENSYPIQLCLNELLQNVFEWADSPIGCLVLTRWFRQTRSVRFAVVDRGIGIPAALRRKRIQNLHRATDADVIEAAVTTPLLTSRANQVGGLGLKTIRDVVCGRSGRLTVVSLGAKVVWNSRGLSKYQQASAFRGTAIEIDIRPNARQTDQSVDEAIF